MASSRGLRERKLSTLTRKIPYRRMLRRTTVVEMPRKYVSIVYRRQKAN